VGQYRWQKFHGAFDRTVSGGGGEAVKWGESWSDPQFCQNMTGLVTKKDFSDA
jgi:hypothetical protein